MSLPATPPSFASSREQPRLVLRFGLLTALGVAAAAAVILVVVRQIDTSLAHGQAIDRARFAARAVLGPELRADDLTATPTADRRRALDRTFAQRLLVEGIRDATLYGTDGRTLYSSSSERSGDRARVYDALGGSIASEVATTHDGSRVLRTYIPIGIGTTRTRAVVALDQDYEHIADAVRRSSLLIAGVLEALLLLLFLAFAPVLARVSNRIRRHVEELDRIATHDELTGLPNRLALRRAADKLRTGGGQGVLLLVDVNGFSEVNNCLGWERGDLLLAEIAARLRRDTPSDDLVARLGEDEFGFLLRDADTQDIESEAERIRASLAAPFVLDGTSVAVTVNLGAALLPEQATDFGTVLRRASAALSSSKTEGRNSLKLYDPKHDSSDTARLAFASDLREAGRRGELRLHYQPQTDLTTHEIRGVEALLRWQHPHRGLLTADEFITHAEQNGLAKHLRAFVLETAAAQWRRWNALDRQLDLAVNLSAADMLDTALPHEIADLIQRYHIPPRTLILEVTERTLIGDQRRAQHVIDRLTRIGVRLAVDDFGTGYASLASLRHFPIDQVKLDRSLLADVPGNPAAEAIVRGSVNIAHGIGAAVVAEGIETRAHYRFAAQAGCDIGQGYFLGRPLPADDLTALLDVPRVAPLTAAHG